MTVRPSGLGLILAHRNMPYVTSQTTKTHIFYKNVILKKMESDFEFLQSHHRHQTQFGNVRSPCYLPTHKISSFL